MEPVFSTLRSLPMFGGTQATLRSVAFPFLCGLTNFSSERSAKATRTFLCERLEEAMNSFKVGPARFVARAETLNSERGNDDRSEEAAAVGRPTSDELRTYRRYTNSRSMHQSLRYRVNRRPTVVSATADMIVLNQFSPIICP